MVVTNDKDRAERLAILRAHGSKPKYYHKVIGGNFRLDALQAAVVSVKLRHLDSWTAARQANAQRYTKMLTAAGVVQAGKISLPKIATSRHIFNQYVIRTPKRDALMAFFKERQIGCEIYYPVPLHLQECFAYLGHNEGAFPQSERAAKETLALPIYPELSGEQAQYVVDSIAEFIG